MNDRKGKCTVNIVFSLLGGAMQNRFAQAFQVFGAKPPSCATELAQPHEAYRLSLFEVFQPS
jgi:hypothetical protein